MAESKKPDQVVFNPETQKYDAGLKSYGTSVGAPAITTNDTNAWKNRSIQKVNQKVAARYLELKEAYDQMMQEFEHNNLIYNSNFSFEPIVGQTYHLYERVAGDRFLSIIAPHECNFKAMGSFYLNADQIWEKL